MYVLLLYEILTVYSTTITTTGKVRRDSGINKLEIHLTKYLNIWLGQKLLLPRNKVKSEMESEGHACTYTEKVIQAKNYKVVRPHICR